MGRKIIIDSVRAASAVRQNVVRLPIISIDGSAADVATTACLAEHLAAVCFCEHGARGALTTA